MTTRREVLKVSGLGALGAVGLSAITGRLHVLPGDPGFTKLFANPRPFTVEQWTFTNDSGGWFHPVHVHLAAAKIIARNTNGGKPFAWELGPKDVLYTGEGESVTAPVQFATQPDGEGK